MDTRTELGLRERAGEWVGRSWATPVAAISALRHARMFHPRGQLFTGRVVASPASRFATVAHRLEGHALVRLSGALSKRESERFEVLGLGLRISSAKIDDPRPLDGDQDLLFATIVSPLTMALSPFTTRASDFLANHYYAVAPFEIDGIGRVKLRLRPTSMPQFTGSRSEKLARAVEAHHVRFALEFRRTFHLLWEPLAVLVLDEPSDLDQEALRFDPFRTGRNVVPMGFVHSLRAHVYPASQAARPGRSL